MKLRSISVCNKALLWGKTQSYWMGLAAKWVGLCPPRPIHGCTPAQLGEIHRLGPNEFISIDWFPYMNCNSLKSLKLWHVVFVSLFSIFILSGTCIHTVLIYGILPTVWLVCQVIKRSEEHTSELQSLEAISYAVFCLKKKNSWVGGPKPSKAHPWLHPCPVMWNP